MVFFSSICLELNWKPGDDLNLSTCTLSTFFRNLHVFVNFYHFCLVKLTTKLKGCTFMFLVIFTFWWFGVKRVFFSANKSCKLVV